MRKLKDFIIRVFCLLIPYKQLRHNVRAYLLNFDIFAILEYYRLKYSALPANSILVIEPNNCHGEVIPGFVKYLNDLGYNVDVVMHSKVYRQRPFSRIHQKNNRYFLLNYYLLNALYKLKKLADYKLILLTSSSSYHYAKDKLSQSSMDVLKLRDLKNVAVVEHELDDVERFEEESYIKAGRLITLGQFEQGVMVNPHYFGPIKTKSKNSMTTFVVVGGINPKRKNHAILIEAIKGLLDQGMRDFKVNVIGRGNLKSLPSEIRPYVKIKGFLDFPAMYKEMEKADFFLPLLDENNSDHDRYITTGVTGSAQLIYAFAMPPVIHKKFASFYGFEETNAIIYENNIVKAMATAINLNKDEYSQMQNNLKTLAAGIYEQSLSNLSKILEHEK